ncbi:MAG: IS1595 family transposase [Gaiellaceae bacterium]
MAARKRDSVKRQASSDATFSHAEFLARFPDNAACLDYLRDKFFPEGTECPKCGKPSKFHRIKGRSAYSCQHCGHHVYPTAGTIFHKTTVNLQLWFYAIFLMASTRCGISAKQLEREIGVSNKTALRMFHQIRSLLGDDGDEPPLTGKVEMDETWIGGKPRETDRRIAKEKGWLPQTAHYERHTPVFAAVERGGRVRARVVPNVRESTLAPHIHAFVLPAAMIYTDEYKGYDRLTGKGFTHHRIKHKERIYVDGDVHTQTIEGFFGLVKNGIRGVYHSVSRKHLQGYLDEYAFRYNNRDSETPMFWAILDRVQKRPAPALPAA